MIGLWKQKSDSMAYYSIRRPYAPTNSGPSDPLSKSGGGPPRSWNFLFGSLPVADLMSSSVKVKILILDLI